MASNSFGSIFRVTTWGESHGRAIGAVIDGCPAGLELSDQDINRELARRAPGKNSYTTSRAEEDQAGIYSGVFENKTTGTPISIIIFNQDARTAHYEPIKDLLRPGHANFTYLEKYGTFDYRGGGRASARETACRVAAGAVAKKLLSHYGIQVGAFLKSIASLEADLPEVELDQLKILIEKNPLFCPDEKASEKMMSKIEEAKLQGDSLGGVVSFIITGAPVGLGDPLYEKLEANLAKAMLSLPATKAFELGAGAKAAQMNGSTHNDAFLHEHGRVQTKTNYAGGTLGGIATGMPVYGSIVFKPTSSIRLAQSSLNLQGEESLFQLPEGSRHDPCVAIRAVPVVEAMCALVVADALLLNRCARLDY